MSLKPHARFLIIFFAVGLFSFVGAHAFAQTSAGLQSSSLAEFGGATILPSTPLPLIIARLIRAVLGVMGIVLTVLIIWAGYTYMTAGGDPKAAERAKNIIKNAVIGLVIALSAYTITQFIISRLEAALGLGGITNQPAVARYAEPLGAALNGKVIQDHYPARNALDIPRNTKIMITFVDPISPASIIDGYAANPASTDLNVSAVKIYQTEGTATTALAKDKVRVSMSADKRTFVFKAVDLLGNDLKDTNYTVALVPSSIRTALGASIPPAPGYSWTFQVSTKIDLTPPQVVSVVPVANSEQDRNVTVEITFNEAMDPTTVSGIYSSAADGAKFTDLLVKSKEKGSQSDGTAVSGAFAVSNGYRTVDFTTDLACAKDPCGNTVYCLPESKDIRVEAHAAKIDTTSPPQALLGAGGVADAAGNSLDGNANGKGDGPGKDDYVWSFTTNDTIDKTVPAITAITPSILEPKLGPDTPVSFTFNMPMKASTLTNSNVQLWPDEYYAMWFLGRSTNYRGDGTVAGINDRVGYTKATVEHPALIRTEEGGHDYYPVVTNDVRGNNQFCFFPAIGPGYDAVTGKTTGSCSGGVSAPYCCNGSPSTTACSAPKSKTKLPDTSQ